MVVVLNVAEKPSVARELSVILSRNQMQKRSGQSKYNPVFSFRCGVMGQEVDMVFTSVIGHIMETDFEATVRALFGAGIVKTLRSDPTVKNIAKTLELEGRKAQWLILWLDCDREGENIAVEVRDVCCRVNRTLDVYRAKFSALIPQDIFAAVQSLGRIDINKAKAVDARSELDLRIGAAFTRFQTMRLQDKFAGLNQVISYGPCQFPTLGFVVDRYNQILSFVREEFWHIKVVDERAALEAEDLRDERFDSREKAQVPHLGMQGNEGAFNPGGKERAEFIWARKRLFHRLSCLVFYEAVLANPLAVVTKADGRVTTRRKPLPLATVELQKRCTRWLRVSADKCMAAAESLYNKGYISYPRTETDSFKEGTDLHGLVSMFIGVNEMGDYAQQLMDGGKYAPPRNGSNDDNAHPPIHPTKAVGLDALIGDEKKVYELIVRHFLACCSKDAVGFQTSVDLNIAGEMFHTSGLSIREMNYLEIYVYDKWSESTLPGYKVGDQFIPHSITMEDGRTQPPPLLSEADLIGLMDKHGIGTDATMHEHIKTILTRNYAEKVNTSMFKPTPLGLALVNGYAEMGWALGKPELRAAMEKDCKAIVEGQKSKEEVIQRTIQEMSTIFDNVWTNAALLEASVLHHYEAVDLEELIQTGDVLQGALSLCGLCTNLMALMGCQSGEGEVPARRFLRCNTCQKSYNLPSKGTISPVADALCPLCRFQPLAIGPGEGYDGRSYHLCPNCYRNLPAQEGQAANGAPRTNFRCFQCIAENCALAEGVVEQIVAESCWSCTQPNTPVILKKTKTGRWLVTCRSAPQICRNTIWLPECTKQAKVATPETLCRSCSEAKAVSVHRIDFIFVAGSVPPHLAGTYQACALCDNNLKEIMQMSRRSAPVTGAVPPHVAGHGSMRPRAANTGTLNAAENSLRRPTAVTVLADDFLAAPELEDLFLAAETDRRPVRSSAQPNASRNSARTSFVATPNSAVRFPTTSSGAVNERAGTSRGGFTSKDRKEDIVERGNTATTEGRICDRCGSGPMPYLTVRKEGVNKGRHFHRCNDCDTMFWADEEDQDRGLSSRTNSRGGRGARVGGRGRGAARGSTSTKPGNCYRCNEPGHFANDCPAGSGASRGFSSYSYGSDNDWGGGSKGRGRGGRKRQGGSSASSGWHPASKGKRKRGT